MMQRLYLQGGMVLCHARAKLQALDILIDKGKFEALLPAGTRVDDALAIDVSHMLIHPGLINAHAHGHSSLGKGLADRWSLELLLAAGPAVYGRRRLQDQHLSTLLGAAELALKGCTAVYDMSLEGPLPTREGVHAAASAYEEVGLRAVLAPMVSDISFFRAIPGLMDSLPVDIQSRVTVAEPLSAADITQALDDVLKHWPSSCHKVRPALAPTIPLHCSDDLWKGCQQLADQYDLSIQTHLMESKVQALSGLKRYQQSMTGYLHGMGVLNSRFVAAHGVWLDERDMRLLGKTNASVSHNPSSNTLLGNGLADARAMQSYGINVALGSDGSTCGDNLNMYESMRMALRVSHILYTHPDDWLSAADVFQMATENGAKALGIPDTGRIEKNHRADLVCLDLTHPNWMPVNDPIVQLVQSEDATAVHSVMVDGQWVVRNHRLVNERLHNLQVQAQAAAQYLKENNQEEWGTYKRIEPAVSCFCAQLMKTPYRVERLPR